MKHGPIRPSGTSGTIPAGTDLRVTAERYDADTERLAAEFVAPIHPALQRDAERTFREMAALFRPAFVRKA